MPHLQDPPSLPLAPFCQGRGGTASAMLRSASWERDGKKIKINVAGYKNNQGHSCWNRLSWVTRARTSPPPVDRAFNSLRFLIFEGVSQLRPLQGIQELRFSGWSNPAVFLDMVPNSSRWWTGTHSIWDQITQEIFFQPKEFSPRFQMLDGFIKNWK